MGRLLRSTAAEQAAEISLGERSLEYYHRKVNKTKGTWYDNKFPLAGK